MHWRRVESAGDLQDAVEVVELLEDDHDLEDSRHHRHALLEVLALDDALLQPERELKTSQQQQNNNTTPSLTIIPDIQCQQQVHII